MSEQTQQRNGHAVEIDRNELDEFRRWKAASNLIGSGQGLLVQGGGGPLKLDLGCGSTVRREATKLTKANGWTGVDLPGTQGADVHTDLAASPWPWPDGSVDEVNCAHTVEHIPRQQRAHFFNELWRVLKTGAKATITTPHWCSGRAYGDITHEWPPVSEMFYSYMLKSWRDINAPHTGFVCNFTVGYGYLTDKRLEGRNQEFILKALQEEKEAASDMVATLTKVP